MAVLHGRWVCHEYPTPLSPRKQGFLEKKWKEDEKMESEIPEGLGIGYPEQQLRATDGNQA